MANLLPQNDPKICDRPIRSQALGAACLAVPAVALALMAAVPGPLVLPALAILAVASGLLLAACLWLSRWAGRVVQNDWRHDLAAALVLLGFAATMLTNMPEAMQSLTEIEASLADLAAARH